MITFSSVQPFTVSKPLSFCGLKEDVKKAIDTGEVKVVSTADFEGSTYTHFQINGSSASYTLTVGNDGTGAITSEIFGPGSSSHEGTDGSYYSSPDHGSNYDSLSKKEATNISNGLKAAQ
jgi:hypothetical protein